MTAWEVAFVMVDGTREPNSRYFAFFVIMCGLPHVCTSDLFCQLLPESGSELIS